MAKRGTSKENEAKLRAFLAGSSPGTKQVGQHPGKNAPGRPKTRLTRPPRSAAKRTHPGEERYLVTLRIAQIDAMKKAAVQQEITIKEAYARAIKEYLEQVQV